MDISPTALATAERRANEAGVQVTFAVTDSTKLKGYTEAFDTIVDSGMFHCLDDDGKRSYAAAAHRATRPGATLLLSCFSDANPADEEWPRPAVSEQTAARRPRRRGLGYRITGARHLAPRDRRQRGRNGVLVRPRATAHINLIRVDLEDQMSDKPNGQARPLIGFITRDNAPQISSGTGQPDVDVRDASRLGHSVLADPHR